MENETISIKKLFGLIINKIWLVIIAAVIFAAAAFSISKFLMPLQYQSHTSLFVKNTERSSSDANLSSYDINTARNLASTYIVVLKDDAVMKELSKALISELGVNEVSKYFTVKTDLNNSIVIPPSQLLSCIEMTSLAETEVIKITATTESPELSADICNLLADIAPEFLIRVVGAGSVESIGSADVNPNPVAPNVIKNTMLGLILGIVLAVAVIFLIDFFDNTVKENDVLSAKFQKPILGEIQFFSADKKQKRKKKYNEFDTNERTTLLNDDIPFYVTESYKAMRTNLIFSLSTSDKKIVAVSSPMPGEGKSTTAANLAIALAQTDSKVLLIDGDLRKPVQHKTFNTSNKNGLSNILGKMKKLDECICKTSLSNLDLLTSGPKPPNPSELLASSQTEKLLGEVSEKYDYIIIDTPPVNVVSDTLGLNKYIAGIILVLRYGATTYDDISESMKNMELSDSKIMGFVLNDITKKENSYHNYKYKYKDKYGYKSGYGYTSIVSDYDDEKNKKDDKKSAGEKKSKTKEK